MMGRGTKKVENHWITICEARSYRPSTNNQQLACHVTQAASADTRHTCSSITKQAVELW